MRTCQSVHSSSLPSTDQVVSLAGWLKNVFSVRYTIVGSWFAVSSTKMTHVKTVWSQLLAIDFGCVGLDVQWTMCVTIQYVVSGST